MIAVIKVFLGGAMIRCQPVMDCLIEKIFVNDLLPKNSMQCLQGDYFILLNFFLICVTQASNFITQKSEQQNEHCVRACFVERSGWRSIAYSCDNIYCKTSYFSMPPGTRGHR